MGVIRIPTIAIWGRRFDGEGDSDLIQVNSFVLGGDLAALSMKDLQVACITGPHGRNASAFAAWKVSGGDGNAQGWLFPQGYGSQTILNFGGFDAMQACLARQRPQAVLPETMRWLSAPIRRYRNGLRSIPQDSSHWL